MAKGCCHMLLGLVQCSDGNLEYTEKKATAKIQSASHRRERKGRGNCGSSVLKGVGIFSLIVDEDWTVAFLSRMILPICSEHYLLSTLWVGSVSMQLHDFSFFLSQKYVISISMFIIIRQIFFVVFVFKQHMWLKYGEAVKRSQRAMLFCL